MKTLPVNFSPLLGIYPNLNRVPRTGPDTGANRNLCRTTTMVRWKLERGSGHAGLGVEERRTLTCVLCRTPPTFDWWRQEESSPRSFLRENWSENLSLVCPVSSLSIAGPGAFAAAPAPRLRIEEAVVQHAGLLET